MHAQEATGRNKKPPLQHVVEGSSFGTSMAHYSSMHTC